MISPVAFFLLPLIVTGHADHHKLFRVSRNGGSPSYVFGTSRRAWVPSVNEIPVEIRRAIQKSNHLVFAGVEPEYRSPASMSPKSRARLQGKASVLDRLGLAGREAYFKVLPTRAALSSEFLHPAMLLMIALKAHLDRQRDEDADFKAPSLIEVDGELETVIREVLGPTRDEWSLARAASQASEKAEGGRILLFETLRELGRRARTQVHVIPATTTEESPLDVMLDTVEERDLERGLLHLLREGQGSAESRYQRRYLLDTLRAIVSASYFVIDHAAIVRLRAQDIANRLDGLERYRRVMEDRRTLWASEIAREMSQGGTFVATELHNFFETGDAAAPGLKEILEDEGLDVTPVEIDCSSSLLSTNVAPYQGTTRSTPWRLKLPSASSNPTP